MSLKAFHVFFLVMSVLISVGFGAWAIREYRSGSDITNLYMGVGSFFAAAVLCIYGAWFLRKLRGVSYV